MNTAADLWRVMHAVARNLRPEHLTRLGITADDAIAAGGLGIANITICGDGLFEFGGDLTAMVLPVFWGPLPTPGAPVPDNELIDLAAFDLSNPEQVWQRRGDGVFLNAGALDDLWLDAPLPLYRTPHSWLRVGAQGAVVLDWQRAACRLRSVATLVAEDADHAKDIRRRLQQPPMIPEIRLPASTLSRAA